MRLRTALLAVLALSVVTACSTPQRGHPRASPQHAPASKPASITPNPARGFEISARISTSAARRDDSGYNRLYLTPKHPDAPGTGYLALTTNGELVTSSSPPPDEPEDLTQGTVGIFDGHTLRVLKPSPKGQDKRPRQTIYAASQGPVVTWLETTSTDMFSADWMVYARNLNSGTTHLLGDSSSLAEGTTMPDIPGGSKLTIGGGLVAWATPRPSHTKPPFESDIVARPVDGSGTLTTLARHAKLPAFDGKALYYARSHDVDPTMSTSHYEIHRRDAAGTDTVLIDAPLEKDQNINILTTSSTRLAWVIGSNARDRSTLYVREKSGTIIAFKLNHAGASTAEVSMTDSLLAWGNGSASSGDYGDYVYDFRRKQLWRAGGALGYSAAYAAGDYFAWPEMTGPGGTARWWVAKMK